MWHVAGFNPRTSGAFRRAGWAPWLSEDRELPYLYENTSTNRVAVFRENMYDSMGRRRRHWCVWDGDNRSRLAAVRADKRARRVDFLAGIQTSLIAEAATVDGVENRGSSWRRSARWRRRFLDAVAVALIAAGGLDGSVLTVRAPLRARGPRALAATLGTSCPGRLAARAALAALLFRHRCAARVASSAGSKRQSVRLPMRSRRCAS